MLTQFVHFLNYSSQCCKHALRAWSRCAVSWGVLIVFIVTSTGMLVPPVGTPTSGCQCSQESQASNTCCCAAKQKASGGATASCCSQKQLACCAEKVASCCQSKSTGNNEAKSGRKKHESTACLSACSCGSAPGSEFMINLEPRLLTGQVLAPTCDLFETACTPPNSSPLTPYLPLETPPPKQYLV